MTEDADQAVAEIKADNTDVVAGESIDYAEILRRIPHRYPFLLIDRGENWVKNKTMTGIKNVTFNEPFFPGHFPENPVMPGVLIIEAIGQTGAVLMSKSLDADVEGKTIFFMSVDGARFRSPVRPGDTLHMKVEVLRHRGDVFKFKGEAYVNGKVVCECEFAAMVVESPK
ncbi:3-hydroxyacyl-ACP dehydratase FabZ [Asticcacaulis sp. ZE23SCel15]|uniref:3-hydroxyacyl-ACP dehydratase FabZ n=1 Tax=unclassified Asticcacaulis TaxID=2628350 RepID=UPI00226C9BE2|nr:MULTISPECIES: 3-hydroxyacyl-ACP dehydratase FabZ [unclassified Asticcacaulis]WAC48984.1 3-hydroxyacyl-ACP dehydratase FabZ [Asticcacaulis sp. SL142]WKL56775.1 3-hydroxyacyl-ACP dehydratase FabZ [Asticcacaulis sp. ZE23SCel15]